MASIVTQRNGTRMIQFTPPGARKRETLRLGHMCLRQVELIKVRVEHLLYAATARNPPDPETAAWVAGLNDRLAEKLAAVGLLPKRASTTLGAFLDDYIEKRAADTKPTTRLVYGHTRRLLVEYFGSDKPLRDITPGDADEWRRWMVGKGLADNTVRRRSGIAKQYFKAALRKRLISTNPFADLKAGVLANPKRMHFISRTIAQRVIDACPDAQWRLIFALSRYGGLRCPSETIGLRWADINWETSRMLVRSPKTEHHFGCEERQVPIFPELLPHLREVFEQAEPGVEFVITRYRDNTMNLRTQLLKIIRCAGEQPWPKLFQNLRSTRETELAEEYPLHVVCSWIGNSQPVAAKHYLQVTEDHFASAVGTDLNSTSPKSDRSALQKALQQPAERGRNAPHGRKAASRKPQSCEALRNDATPCQGKGLRPMGVTGLEPVTSCVSSRRSSQLSYTPGQTRVLALHQARSTGGARWQRDSTRPIGSRGGGFEGSQGAIP